MKKVLQGLLLSICLVAGLAFATTITGSGSSVTTTVTGPTSGAKILAGDVNTPLQTIVNSIYAINTTLTSTAASLTSHLADLTYPHLTKTIYTFSSSSGWTQTAGTGSASITGGQARLSISLGTVATYDGSNGYLGPRIFRSHGADQTCFSVYARLVNFTNSDNFSNTGLEIRNTDASQLYTILVIGDGTVYAGDLTANSNLTNSAIGALPLDGTGWMALRLRGLSLTFQYGTGTSSVPPTIWTVLRVQDLGSYNKGFDRFGFFQRQVISGAAAQVSATWDDARVIDDGGLLQY
jgi:hypothetical protein